MSEKHAELRKRCASFPEDFWLAGVEVLELLDELVAAEQVSEHWKSVFQEMRDRNQTLRTDAMLRALQAAPPAQKEDAQ